jgi:hypothetical protein
MRVPHFCEPIQYVGLCTMQEPANLVSIPFRMVLTQLITHVYKRFSHLDISTKYQYLIRITILLPTSRFFDTIIDVDY